MTKSQMIKCNAIIHAASLSAAGIGAGLAQVPGSDSKLIIPIQSLMTISLGKVFGKNLDSSAAKSLMATGTTTMIGRAASQFAVGWIPRAGNIINAATAGVITESLGWILAKEFEKDLALPEQTVLSECA